MQRARLGDGGGHSRFGRDSDVNFSAGVDFSGQRLSAPRAGSDDPSLSAREAIIPIVNGPRGAGDSQRQGLQSAVAGEGAR